MKWGCDIYFLLYLFLPTSSIENINVQVFGLMDLSRHFGFEYSILPEMDRAMSRHKKSKILRSRNKKTHIPRAVTQFVDPSRNKKRHHKHNKDTTHNLLYILNEGAAAVRELVDETRVRQNKEKDNFESEHVKRHGFTMPLVDEVETTRHPKKVAGFKQKLVPQQTTPKTTTMIGLSEHFRFEYSILPEMDSGMPEHKKSKTLRSRHKKTHEPLTTIRQYLDHSKKKKRHHEHKKDTTHNLLYILKKDGNNGVAAAVRELVNVTTVRLNEENDNFESEPVKRFRVTVPLVDEVETTRHPKKVAGFKQKWVPQRITHKKSTTIGLGQHFGFKNSIAPEMDSGIPEHKKSKTLRSRHKKTDEPITTRQYIDPSKKKKRHKHKKHTTHNLLYILNKDRKKQVPLDDEVKISRHLNETDAFKYKWVAEETPETTKKFNYMTQMSFVRNNINESNIYDSLHKVKDDAKIKDFSVHILRQTLQVFEVIKNKIEDRKIRNKIDVLSKNYEQKFSSFVHETQDQNIKSKLGTQKVILNTIDTSNRILRRLMNYLIGDVNSALENEGMGNVIQSEVKKETELEYLHACKKFGICRSKNGFRVFLMDFFNELVKNKDMEVKKATDAIAKNIENTDFSKVVEVNPKKRGIFKLKTMATSNLRPMYEMFRNTIRLRIDEPIAETGGVDKSIVNKALAFMEIVDTLDDKVEPNYSNVMKWKQIMGFMTKWNSGIGDIRLTMANFVRLLANVTKQIDGGSAWKIKQKLTLTLGDIGRMRYDYF